MFQFDRYKKSPLAQSIQDSRPISYITVPSLLRTSSLMAKATEGYHAQELFIVKDLHAELITYLAEDLYFFNEALSPELQGQTVFQY